jgi:hypothetical protein
MTTLTITTATTTATSTNFEENQQTLRDTKRPLKDIEGPPGTAKNELLRFPYALPLTAKHVQSPIY